MLCYYYQLQVCCSVLRRVAVYCGVLQYGISESRLTVKALLLLPTAGVLQHVAVCSSVVRSVAVCCGMLQCVVVCRIVRGG